MKMHIKELDELFLIPMYTRFDNFWEKISYGELKSITFSCINIATQRKSTNLKVKYIYITN